MAPPNVYLVPPTPEWKEGKTQRIYRFYKTDNNNNIKQKLTCE